MADLRPWRTTELRVLVASNDAMHAAEMTGRSPRATQDAARRFGLPVPRMPHACYWPEATRQRALRMRASGASVAQISQALGVPFGTARRWVYDQKEKAA